MNELQQTRIAVAIAPGVIKDDAAFTSNVIDLLDFPNCDYIEFIGVIGSIDATMADLYVVADDDAAMDTPTQIIASADTLPGADDDNKVFVFGVDLRNRGNHKRYMALRGTAGNGAAGTYLAAVAIGRRLGQSSPAAADRNTLFATYA